MMLAPYQSGDWGLKDSMYVVRGECVRVLSVDAIFVIHYLAAIIIDAHQ